MRGFPIARTVLGVLIFLGTSLAAAAQEIPGTEINGPLAKISVTGSQRFSSDAIAATINLQKGQTLHPSDLQAAADRLAQTGEFANVNYRYEATPQGIVVELSLADAPVIPAYFDNFPWLPNELISQSLAKAVPFYDGRVPSEGTVVDDVAQALTKLLDGVKISGSVTHRVLRAPGSDQLVQEFQLDGPQLPIEAVFFTDALADEDRAVHQSLNQLIGHPYSRYAIETFTFEQVRPLYEASGHLHAIMGEPAARFSGEPNQPPSQSVTAIIPVQAGPVYKWGGATWTGSAAISAGDLNSLVGLKDGELADGTKLDAAWLRIADAYAHIGYLDAAVTPSLELNDAAARASCKIAIVEGPQYHMG
ncbi:MAG TPA: FtsQ-type POTRA domain-containing protein, partial [Candidatus Acidoferrales bacterium]|nr:FtsQ-type POTRA domain-containing protein [Candidatus Acidoferrales bacterium]